ncbi:putative methylmalonyl-coenzyme a mutase [Leptomonas seymouri]|uniref:Putative methylmalonyl-coenzyme a mutase n=1 Tax=Leptomonas seymouri TaxID=5684 RepID=A0A0N1IKV0_LEPSE|nr:putative methylmalonyl-coenzyme a mutase [Leptomonas seymouri]|eukprot:KPI86642.1 putative methylmalonyl-coenzyme a mutase [Leptomonas seymouri]
MRCILSRVAAAPPAAAATAAFHVAHTSLRLCSTTFSARKQAPLDHYSPAQHYGRREGLESDKLLSIAQYTRSFAEAEGRRPRILLCTFEDCAQGRPDDKFATMMASLGFDIDIGPARQSPEQVARQAVEADVHGIHVSVLTEAGAVPLPRLAQSLTQEGAENVFITATATTTQLRMPDAVAPVQRGDFVGAAEMIQRLLQASEQDV